MRLLKSDKVTLTVGGKKIEEFATNVELCEEASRMGGALHNKKLTVNLSARVTYTSPAFKLFLDEVAKSRTKRRKRKRKP